MAKKKVADWIVDSLEAAGVKNCYGLVGDSINCLADALHRSSIEWVHVRHEEVAAFAAGAESYFTDGLSVCSGSCGPGSLHLINGIFEANRNRSPVVFLCSQIATDKINLDFPQEVDFKPLFAQCSVFCKEVVNPKQAQSMVEQAARAAIEKRGVAVVILPADVLEAQVEGHKPKPLVKLQTVLRPGDEELKRLAELLSRGKKITIFAGAGAKGAHKELIALAEKLKAPIAHTSRGKDFVEYDNPYNMGMTGLLGVKSGYYAVSSCDTLLMLGTDFAYPQFYEGKITLLQIDENPERLGRRHPVDFAAVGSIKDTLAALLPLVEKRQETAFLQECLKKRKETLETLAKEEQRAKGIIHPQYFVSLLDKYADNDAIMTADVGSPMVWAVRHFRTNGKRRTLISLLHGTMANAMPEALGAQKAYPKRQIISLSGDGGLAMLMGDMLTAIQEKLPIKIALIDNNSLNFVEMEQKVEGMVNRYTNLVNPDFGEVAQAIGFWGKTVDKAEELDTAVQEFLKVKGPALLNVRTTPYELVMPPRIEAEHVTNTALYSMRAIAEGRIKDVKNLLVDNFLK